MAILVAMICAVLVLLAIDWIADGDGSIEPFYGGFYYPYDYPYYYPYFYSGCNENVFGQIDCLPYLPF